MANMDTNRLRTKNEPVSPDPAQANDDMEMREAMGDRSPSVVRETDAVSTNRLALPTVGGVIAGGVIGAIVGLIVSTIPAIGLDWWLGLVIGAFVGITLGGFVAGRLALNTADGGASGTYRFPGGGNQPR